MELLLNLAWLLLMVPAIWIWHTASGDRKAGKRPFSLLVLACVLILLFPVVSATDDLQAMQPDMEEAAVRDAVSASAHGKCLTSGGGQGNLHPLLTALHPLQPASLLWGLTILTAVLQSATHQVATCAGRAPPVSFLG